MTRATFLSICRKRGDIKKEIAEAYAAGRDEFTDEDFEIVLRQQYRWVDHKCGFHSYEGAQSTKIFLYKGSDR